MIGRIETTVRRWRRRLRRSEWLAHLLGLPTTSAPKNATGLVLIQVDGLSRPELERALAKGEMPFLKRLQEREHYQLHDLFAGVPSTTPAVQAELFYGVKSAVPGFGYMDRESRQLVRMYEPGPAAQVEARLKTTAGPPLLQDGSCYASIFRAGAAEPHFCPAELGWGPALRNARPLALLVMLITHFWSLLRTGALLLIELVLALIDCVRGLIQGQNLVRELLFVPTRIVITILMRELTTIGANIDIARGLPVIFLNFLGYDEQSHRRGPDSAFAHWTLKGIDDAIARVWRAAHHSAHRHYDVWIYSDHGQEKTQPYESRYGQSFAKALTAAIAQRTNRPIAYRATGQRGVQLQRVRLFGGNRVQRLFPIDEPDDQTHDGNPLVISTLGPIAMLYLPDTSLMAPAEMARLIVEDTGAPLVLYKADARGQAYGWCAEGAIELPRDGPRLLGADHPFASEAARDLAALCHQRDAGDFVICGWRDGAAPISFAIENGAHGGAGPHETHAFALLPADIHKQNPPQNYWRATDLRQAAQRFLRPAPSPLPCAQIIDTTTHRPLRVMTYNVHRCIGMDGKLSPERVARVIARHEPDIVALQELDVGRARTGGVDQARQLAHLLEMEYHFHPSFQVEEERYGDAILSRLPIQLVRAGALPGVRSAFPWEPRGALWVVVHYRGQKIQVINTHFGLSPAERSRQASALLSHDWLGHPDCQEPRILCGDFNAGPGSAVYRRLLTQLNDAQTTYGQYPPKGTFFGRLPRTRIDHIFIEPSLRVNRIDVPSTELVRLASDHLPLMAELNWD